MCFALVGTIIVSGLLWLELVWKGSAWVPALRTGAGGYGAQNLGRDPLVGELGVLHGVTSSGSGP